MIVDRAAQQRELGVAVTRAQRILEIAGVHDLQPGMGAAERGDELVIGGERRAGVEIAHHVERLRAGERAVQ